MRSNEEVAERLATLAAALEPFIGVDWTVIGLEGRLMTMLGLETQRRKELAVSSDIGTSLSELEPRVLGDTPKNLIADILRISPKEPAARLNRNALLEDRHTLSGEPLSPHLPATAAAWHQGLLDPEHVTVVKKFFREIPRATPQEEKDKAEQFLAAKATQMRPDELKQVAQRLAITINPDGIFTDADRVAKSGFSWGPQRVDGMSKGTLYATPALRAAMDAYLDKFAAPGMCMPGDTTAVPTDPDTAAATDPRCPSQRRHDALFYLLRSHLGDPDLGKHRGMPVSIIATAELNALANATGWAVTATGTVIPITDLIAMIGQGYTQPYLLLFEHHKRIPLYFAKADRCATEGQRLALFATDRGCTFPGCHRPAIQAEAHHHKPWATHQRTNICDLTWACWEHHPLVCPGGWTNSIDANGTVHWHPPAHYPRNTPTTNNFHHPERWLHNYGHPEKPDKEGPEDDPG